MTVPDVPYETFKVETPDHRTGVIEVYEGVVVETSICLADLLGEPWYEVSQRLAQVWRSVPVQ